VSIPPPPHDTPSDTATADSTPAAEGSALRSPAAHLRFWLVVIGGLVLDLWSKHWAFHAIGQNNSWELIPNVLEFHITLNAGALFGLGQGQTTLFVIASFLALGLVLWMFSQCPARRWFMQIALGAILAGALGNMYDRVNVRLVKFLPDPSRPVVVYCEPELSDDGRVLTLREYPPTPESAVFTLPAGAVDGLGEEHGYVRDFIKISQKWFGGRDVWPWVFNVADMLLVGGVCVLAFRLLRDGRGVEAPADGVDSDVSDVAAGDTRAAEPAARESGGEA
jgi:lipoprotein signal peptidase